MATSRCSSCGLIRQDCQCCRQTSFAPLDITPAYCCTCYFFITCLLFLVSFICTGKLYNHKNFCYLELFANSVSISSTNVSTANWSIGLVTKSPLTRCKVKLHTIKSRLLRGDEVLSVSPTSLDGFGLLVTSEETDKNVITVDYKNVMTPGGVVGGVVWDYRVEFIVGMKGGGRDGFLMVVCGDIPVRFTADPAVSMVGSLLGNMRRCDYLFQDKLNFYV